MREVRDIRVGGCSLGLNCIEPEIQCKSLGMKVEVFDPSGTNIEHTGTPGEMVRLGASSRR
jgi:hypothetical protein